MKSCDKNITPANYDEYWLKRKIFIDERVLDVKAMCPDEITTVVDLGGGSGGLASRLGAIIVDWSPVACKLAEELGIKTYCNDIIDFCESTDKTFNLVILADVLEELPADRTDKLLDGIKRICEKYLVLSTPTHENYLNISTHQVIYSKEELLEMLAKKGFKLDKEIKYKDRLVARFIL